MRRIILLVTVALLITSMMTATATSAFAVSPGFGPCLHPIGKAPQSGGPDPFKPLSGCEPSTEHAHGGGG
jgi:hypothetical protein